MSDTSESLYGLPKQPGETCPMIDQVLWDIEGLRPEFDSVDRSLMRRIDREKPDDETACDLIDDLVYRLEQAEEAAANIDTRHIRKRMEEIRSHVIDIREWGQAWKGLAKETAPKAEQAKTLLGAIRPWWNEREHGQFVSWLMKFHVGRTKKWSYCPAI